MGLAHLNVWVRNRNCDLLTDMWRTDLVIQACTGTYLVDVWPEILTQLQTRYPNYTILNHFYQGAQRIMLMPPVGTFFNHIEIDIPPGCYKVWTRCCHGQNEETSLQLISPRCGEEACVNLLLPTLKICAQAIVHPLIDHIVVQGAFPAVADRLTILKGVMYAGDIGRALLLEQLQYRLSEAVAKGDTALQARVNAVIAIADQLPAC